MLPQSDIKFAECWKVGYMISSCAQHNCVYVCVCVCVCDCGRAYTMCMCAPCVSVCVCLCVLLWCVWLCVCVLCVCVCVCVCVCGRVLRTPKSYVPLDISRKTSKPMAFTMSIKHICQSSSLKGRCSALAQHTHTHTHT